MTCYFFFIEISLKKKKDLNVYAFNNVSHIPTSKLVEIFNIDLEKDPNFIEGYFLTKRLFKRHKQYINEHIGVIDLDVFEYTLRLYSGDNETIRGLYKEQIME